MRQCKKDVKTHAIGQTMCRHPIKESVSA